MGVAGGVRFGAGHGGGSERTSAAGSLALCSVPGPGGGSHGAGPGGRPFSTGGPRPRSRTRQRRELSGPTLSDRDRRFRIGINGPSRQGP